MTASREDSAAEGHLVLVGMMGTGKSTVGRMLAKRLRRPFVDTDAEVERRAQKPVRQIFADDGEAAMRTIESAVLGEALAATTPSVVAAAGGVVIDPGNRELLRRGATRVVWLTAEPDVLARRVRRATHRPLIDGDALAALTALSAQRAPWYREVADVMVATDGRTSSQVVEAILR